MLEMPTQPHKIQVKLTVRSQGYDPAPRSGGEILDQGQAVALVCLAAKLIGQAAVADCNNALFRMLQETAVKPRVVKHAQLFTQRWLVQKLPPDFLHANTDFVLGKR